MKKLKLKTPKWIAKLMLPIKKLWTDFWLQAEKASDKKDKNLTRKFLQRKRLSSNTYRLLAEYQSKQYSFANETLPFAGTAIFAALFLPFRWKACLAIITIELCIFGINYLLVRKDLKRNAFFVYRNDRYDLLLSEGLSNVLNSFKRGSLMDYENDTMPIDGNWKPFRVLHLPSSDINTEFSGAMKLNGGFLFGATRGTLEGDSKGLIVPKLLDSSTIILLTNNKETMRVLIPSPNAVIEFIKQFLENLSADCSTHGSHVYTVLKNFSIKNFPLAHPEVIDKIDFSCQKPLGKRPEILVSGHIIQEGVVFASSIEINGVKNLFYPSGFLKSLMDGIKPYTKSLPSAEKLRMVS